jgi:transcriptional regulator with XRE-family HTH domain
MTQSIQTPFIVNKYLQSTGLSMRKFGRQLGISHVAVSNWAAGKSEPKLLFLFDLQRTFCDWRLQFANDLMRVMFPNLASTILDNGHKSEPCGEEDAQVKQ